MQLAHQNAQAAQAAQPEVGALREQVQQLNNRLYAAEDARARVQHEKMMLLQQQQPPLPPPPAGAHGASPLRQRPAGAYTARKCGY